MESIPGYRASREFADYWVDLAEASAAQEDWLPGDGSVEASLLALTPVLAVPVAGARSLSGVARAAQLGREGEAAVKAAIDIGSKTKLVINGRVRFPDGLTQTVLSEVKNVSKLSVTRQLRDYAQYARANKLRFDLYVRPDTKLSGELLKAEQSGLINIIEIPF